MPGSAAEGYLFFGGVLGRRVPEPEQFCFELFACGLLAGCELLPRQQRGRSLDRPWRGKEPGVGAQPVPRAGASVRCRSPRRTRWPRPELPRHSGLGPDLLGQTRIRPVLLPQLTKAPGQPCSFRRRRLHAATSETAHPAGH